MAKKKNSGKAEFKGPMTPRAGIKKDKRYACGGKLKKGSCKK